MNFSEKLQQTLGKSIKDAANEEIYAALLSTVKEAAADKGRNISEIGRKVYYISAEFLIGKLLSNNLINLGVYDEVRELLTANGKDICEIEEVEPEPSLGNGGLGRLAACFLDSIATLGLEGDGIGLNYHLGLFKQVFENHKQKETPNPWIQNTSWLTDTGIGFDVPFKDFSLHSKLYDIDVTGYENGTNKLHLFDIESINENIVGGGEWEFFSLPEQWQIHYKELTFNLKPFSFKHTGLFPEQATNWDWFSEKIRNAGRPVKVLNLFAYTGGATLAAAAAGASVTHVDASKGMVAWAKENAASSGLSDRPIRWLVDDCVKFVEREIRRGNHYDAIIMDPPSYGRGPKGEIWKIEDAIHPLIKLCTQILSDDPLFFLVNSYTTGLAPAVLTYMLGTELKKWNGHVDSQEIGLPVTHSGLVLPCGASGRWEAV